MYKKVSTTLDFAGREKDTLAFWKQARIFEKSVELRQGAPAYTFYDGPPTANGKPHIGHILTRSIKDIIPRYRTMKGYDVLRKAGWDTHGLPVELEVEKELGLDGKEQIEAYGVTPFIQKCKESVWKYKGEWEEMSDRVGFWADMENPYVTYEDNYIESEWWALKTIHEKGLLYKGHKIVPYCPRCGTALSSHEVAQGYKDIKETSATVRFRCADEDAYYLAWTTTPWTLPSNVCLCVNAHVEYCRARKDGETFILARDLVESVLGEGAEILDVFPGSDLVDRDYEPLFPCTGAACAKTGKRGHYVIADDYVTTTDGTGIVHNAPAFGEDDARVCKEHDMPFIQLVDTRGNMCGGTPWDGAFVKDADKRILHDLKEAGLLFAAPEFEHSYPFCWRCDTPLIYYARQSWFIKMTAIRDRLMEYNRRINWIPETIKEGRMGNFLENVIDWGISRERYWGTPLPVWVCKDCGHVHVVGSRKELCQLAPGTPEDLELHKPFLDPITFPCEKCGGEMRREPVVIDCWFDSGSMPFAQWHYPFENKELFARRYPANFISEAVDQTRGWFYTLLAISTCLFDEPSFQNCLVLGLVQDKDGLKMSKHKGNVVDPWSILDKQGADAVRWYFYTGSMPWLPSRFSPEAVSEAQRKFMGTFWNTYAFYVLYADIDGFDPTAHTLCRENLSPMDKWILSRLNSLVKTVDAYLADIRITEAGRELQRFVDDLSNWYVRRCRDRYWGKDMTPDKEAAYMTLFTVLKTLSLISARGRELHRSPAGSPYGPGAGCGGAGPQRPQYRQHQKPAALARHVHPGPGPAGPVFRHHRRGAEREGCGICQRRFHLHHLQREAPAQDPWAPLWQAAAQDQRLSGPERRGRPGGGRPQGRQSLYLPAGGHGRQPRPRGCAGVHRPKGRLCGGVRPGYLRGAGYPPDPRPHRGGLCPGAGQQDPDHAQGGGFRRDRPYRRLLPGQRYHCRHLRPLRRRHRRRYPGRSAP